MFASAPGEIGEHDAFDARAGVDFRRRDVADFRAEPAQKRESPLQQVEPALAVRRRAGDVKGRVHATVSSRVFRCAGATG